MNRNKKGFTLMEMLIVVAIIAILVAIAIPVFSAQLEKARTAVDAANMRSALSMAVTAAMTDDGKTTTAGVTRNDGGSWTITFAYANNTLSIGSPGEGYNQAKQGGAEPGKATLQVIVDKNYVPTGSWVGGTTTTPGT